MLPNRFLLKSQSGKARRGAYHTSHGTFETPNFMPVGTQATVKGVDAERLLETGAQVALVNTYHLWLRPTPKIVQSLGGIHRFMAWDKPILSDSGGFQVFSLEGIRTLSEQGVEFRSHLNGEKLFLSPEKAVEIQDMLGVDIAMVLDECPKPTYTKEEFAFSLSRTLRWAARCLEVKRRDDLSLFAITQGGFHRDLRGESADALRALPFSGYAIGGLSVGEPKEVMYEVLSYHPEELPANSIRYLMGVGTPQDIVTAVFHGVDLFDCVMPTRSGRFGRAFISGAETPWLNIRNAKFIDDSRPLDEECTGVCCRNYSRAYLHHLFRADEMLGPSLLSIHNLTHYQTLMARIRVAIEEDRFTQFYDAEMERWKVGPEE